MQIELTQVSDGGLTGPASDPGFLSHKRPGHLHERDVAQGKVSPVFPDASDRATRAVIHLDVVEEALDRLSETAPPEDDDVPPPASEHEGPERPLRLHDLRLDAVRDVIVASGARTVPDLGCGEGKLIRRLLRERGIERMPGVDPSIRTLETAARRLNPDDAGEQMHQRVQPQLGRLTHGDRRWQGFDAATLVEVIEHVEPQRLSALELSLFGTARPGLVVVTTPNRDCNALLEGMAPGTLRHGDHRFDWTRAEFAAWADRVATAHGYALALHPLGPPDEAPGAPSRMAVFTCTDRA